MFKIQHWPGANILVGIASLLQATAILTLAYKVMRYPGFKDFLDR